MPMGRVSVLESNWVSFIVLPINELCLEAYFLLRGYFAPVKGFLAVISSIRAVMATPSAIKRAPA